MKKILHLVVKKKWFDQIKSGEKTIEYREEKPYWTKRLRLNYSHIIFDEIHLRNGYSKNAPKVIKKHIKTMSGMFIHPDTGKYCWCYQIHLGEAIE